jgi:hypothetical protein
MSMTDSKRTDAPRRGSKPAPAARFVPGVVGEVRQRNPLWLAGGLLLVVLCALGGVLLYSSADDRTTVVVAASDLQPGRPLTRDDLRVTDLVLTDDVAALSPGQAGGLVGLLPVGVVPAGTLLNEGMFTAAVPLAAGEMVVGAALEPGAAPLSQIDVGAAVEVLHAPPAAPGAAAGAAVAPAESLGRGTVWAVENLATGQVWVSLRVTTDVGQLVAQAAGTGGLRLALVAGG